LHKRLALLAYYFIVAANHVAWRMLRQTFRHACENPFSCGIFCRGAARFCKSMQHLFHFILHVRTAIVDTYHRIWSLQPYSFALLYFIVLNFVNVSTCKPAHHLFSRNDIDFSRLFVTPPRRSVFGHWISDVPRQRIPGGN